MKKYRVEELMWIAGSGESYRQTIDNLDGYIEASDYAQCVKDEQPYTLGENQEIEILIIENETDKIVSRAWYDKSEPVEEEQPWRPCSNVSSEELDVLHQYDDRIGGAYYEDEPVRSDHHDSDSGWSRYTGYVVKRRDRDWEDFYLPEDEFYEFCGDMQKACQSK